MNRLLFFIWLLFFITLPIFSQETEEIDIEKNIDIEELRRQIHDEDPAELMNISLGDNDVSLVLTGTWKGLFQGSMGLVYSPLGMAFNSPGMPFLFEQEADILMSLWINDKWFVEAGFRDDSSFNTYRAGFQGGPDDFIQYAGIGNTGLDFPVFPYLDLGGDSSSSFGFYGRAGTDNLTVHTLLRYDMASREERIFTGSRERTISYIQPDNYIRGVSFVLPKPNIPGIKVYVEDDKGTIIDTDKRRRWRQLLNSEFAAGTGEGLLELGIRPAGMVAVFYQGIEDDVDSYMDTVPAVFSSYPKPGTVSINGDNALVVYDPGLFSPFERKNRYDAPSGNSEQADIVLLSSGSIKKGYELIPISESSAGSDIPLYIQAVSQRNVYELFSAGTVSARDPKRIWPLLDEYPEIYLPNKTVYTGDTALRFTNYSGNSGFFLGTDVVKGSVQVWRSGIQDSNFRFNESSGEVMLNGSVGQNEIIRITYLRKSEEADLGSIAAGLGAVYRRGLSPFSASAAIGVRWNVTEKDAFTEENSESAGSAGISAKTEWEYDNLKAHIAAGFAFEQADTTGLYRAAGMEGHQTIITLPQDTSFISNPPLIQDENIILNLNFSNRAELIYKNYYNNNVLGNTLMPITWQGFTVVSGMNRPYPVKDPLLGNNQILVAEFNLDSEKTWTGFQVPIEEYSDFISRASDINIPYRVDIESGISSFKLIVQIGYLSFKDYPFNENPELVWEKVLDISDAENGVHWISFKIDDDEQRNKLVKANHLRLLAVSDDGGAVTGRVLLASPFIHGAAFKPVSSGIISYETPETGDLSLRFPEIKRLHPEGSVRNRVLAVDWKDPVAEAGVEGRIAEIPLNDYRELSFFAKMPDINKTEIIENGSLNFIVASGHELNNEYLAVNIPLSALSAHFGVWNKITIRYQDGNKGVFVNGSQIPNCRPEYKPVRIFNRNNPVNFVKIVLNPGEGNYLDSGIMYIDEIILEDPCITYRMNAGTAVEYVKKGTIISLNGVTAVSDFKIMTAVESEVRMNGNTDESETTVSVINRSGLDISVFGAHLQTNAAFTLGGTGTGEDDLFYWSADHSVSKVIEGFSIKEQFSASPYDNIVRHNLSLSFLSDFYAKFDADAVYELSRLRQEWIFGTGYAPKNTMIPAVDFSGNVYYINAGTDMEENENYANIWIQSFEPLMPDSGKNANTRRAVSKLSITQRTKPVGAILTLEGITNFTEVNNLTQTENSLFLDIPVNLARSNFNFRMGRGFKRHLNYSGSDIFDEGSLFFESISESAPLWKVFPGYSLFAGDLNGAMDKVSYAQYISFNDHFSTTAALPGRTDFSSFIIPNRCTFRLERVLENKLDTRSDLLNLGASLGFSSVNMFGSMGYKPIFGMYQNDEFNNSIQAAFVFGEEISWRLQSVIGAGFRAKSDGMLNAVNTLTLRNGGYWLESFILDLTTPANKILIDILYGKISNAVSNGKSFPGMAALFSTDYQKLRKESIELIIDNDTDYMRWNMLIGHEEIIKVTDRLEFTGFTKLKFGEDEYRETFAAELLIGTSLRVNF